jgi:hypothetical protein
MKKTALLLSFFLLQSFLIAQNIEWVKSIGGIYSDWPFSLKIDYEGNLLITGHFNGTVDFDPGIESHTLTADDYYHSTYLLKLDAEGEFVWVKDLGELQLYQIETDSLGNVFMSGIFSNAINFTIGSDESSIISNGGSDVIMLKIDSDGEIVWAESIGGSFHDNSYALTIDSYGNVLVSGYFGSTVDFDPGVGEYNLTATNYSDIFVLKLNGQGEFIWARTMGCAYIGLEMGLSISTDLNNNVYTTGCFSGPVDFDPGLDSSYVTSNGVEDVFIQKLDSEGNFVWIKRIGGAGYDRGLSILNDDLGNVYASGYYNQSVDFDPGPDTYIIDAIGTQDFYIIKLNTDGDFLWANSIDAAIHSIAIDSDQNVCIAGHFEDSVDFIFGSDDFYLSSIGERDSYVQKIDDNGDFLWVKHLGSVNNDFCTEIAVDSIGNIIAVGLFIDTIDFNGEEVISNGDYDTFILKLVNPSLAISELEYHNTLVFPNPSHGLINVDLGTLKNARISVFNNMGQLVFSCDHITAPQYQFELKNRKGLYLIEVSTADKKMFSKLLLE